jgi:hypothetical protein
MVEERLAVSQVGVEIEIGFAIVAQTHKPPWHSGLALDLLASRFAVKQPVGLIAGFLKSIRSDFQVGPVVLVCVLYSANDAILASLQRTQKSRWRALRRFRTYR